MKMKKERFLTLIKEQLEDDPDLSFDVRFEQLQGWDSLTMLVITAIKEKMRVDLTVQHLRSCQTIGDIYNRTIARFNGW